jgi:hypothetical protein
MTTFISLLRGLGLVFVIFFLRPTIVYIVGYCTHGGSVFIIVPVVFLGFCFIAAINVLAVALGVFE